MIFAIPDVLLLSLLLATAFAVARLNNLIAVIMLLGLYSLLMALVWVVLDAVDVAFTEAAVGAGITTILMLSAVALVGHEEKPRTSRRMSWPALAVVFATGAVLIYGTADMPALGDPNAPVQLHVAPRYILESPKEIGIPNVITAILASYRGFDTLGEVAVVFTAGVAVLVLLGRGFRRREDEE